LELGRGFMFVGSQQRVTLGNTHYYVDMEPVPKLIDCALRARFWDRLLRFFRLSALQNREFKGCFPKN
jgi:hypothetical protein